MSNIISLVELYNSLKEASDVLEPSNDYYPSLSDQEYDDMWDFVKNDTYMKSNSDDSLYEDDGMQVYSSIDRYAIENVEYDKEFSVSLDDLIEAADRYRETLYISSGTDTQERVNYVGGQGNVD